ncbi:hypothetical protein [Bartonella sp. CL434QHHD]|uniref:hypothetical protein n=1 Tax=Bartonella sp. CL434QHHD TaxID=3243529 RepID=UPI0035CFE0A2
MLESCWGALCWGALVWKGWVCCQRVCFSLSFSEMAVLMSACQEHGKWRLEERRKAERRKGVKEGRGGYACFEGVVHVGVLLGHVWKGWVCCQRVCFSLSFSEMAVLVFVCQEHGKWRLEERRKAERRKDARRAGRMPVRVWCMLECLVLGCLWMSLCGENAFVMRAKWSMLTRFAV